MPQPLLVVDAPSILYRSFYALPKTITGADGRPANALLGTVNQVLRVVEAYDPRAVALCFGPDAADYRVELYAPYHAERPPVPDELAPQFAAAPEFFTAFGWSVVGHDSVEADDLLHSLALAEEEAGGRALLMTGDRDLFQCATDKTMVLYVRTGAKEPDEVDPDEVRKRYGVPPELVADFIALRGDPSDGLPGAKGIGEKTAVDLLRRHSSLDNAIAGALRESAPRVRGALRAQADELRDFRAIATLQRVDVERPRDRATDTAGGARAARERGMKRLSERLERIG